MQSGAQFGRLMQFDATRYEQRRRQPLRRVPRSREMEKADEDCSCRRIPGPLLGLAAVANADAIYDFSYVGYLDEDLTMVGIAWETIS